MKLKALVRYYTTKFGLDFDGEAMLWQHFVECIISQASLGQQYRACAVASLEARYLALILILFMLPGVSWV
ncbi:hypothetical protein [uncultured Parasutterella sp.]|uniref:hypothetical protein n=1 Tax=uncultured Parasutterella sp. TaxID=1263098 RepID=UPI0025915239|nr:hypothetical protein [uncultured Parasutterella sp.]